MLSANGWAKRRNAASVLPEPVSASRPTIGPPALRPPVGGARVDRGRWRKNRIQQAEDAAFSLGSRPSRSTRSPARTRDRSRRDGAPASEKGKASGALSEPSRSASCSSPRKACQNGAGFRRLGSRGPPGSNAAGHPCRAVSISVHTAVIGLRSSVGAQNGPNGARAWKSGGLAMVAEDDRQKMHAIGSPGRGGIQAGLLAAGAIGRHVDGLGHMAPSPR